MKSINPNLNKKPCVMTDYQASWAVGGGERVVRTIVWMVCHYLLCVEQSGLIINTPESVALQHIHAEGNLAGD